MDVLNSAHPCGVGLPSRFCLSCWPACLRRWYKGRQLRYPRVAVSAVNTAAWEWAAPRGSVPCQASVRIASCQRSLPSSQRWLRAQRLRHGSCPNDRPQNRPCPFSFPSLSTMFISAVRLALSLRESPRKYILSSLCGLRLRAAANSRHLLAQPDYSDGKPREQQQ